VPSEDDSADRDRQLVEASPDGIVLLRGGCIARINPAARTLLNIPIDRDCAGAPFVDFVQPDDRHALLHHLTTYENAAARSSLDVTPLASTASHRAIEITSAPYTDADGCGILLVLRDITARRHAEHCVRENEERLTLAFAGSREGIWDWNIETGYVFYSARWKDMLGYASEEISPTVAAWSNLLHPEDRGRALRINEAVSRGKDDYEMEVRLRHKDGHYVYVLSRGFPVRRTPHGPVVRIVGTHLDLSERKAAEAALRESEERLTLAFAGAQEGVWDWNLVTGAVVYSPRWIEMLGYEAHEIAPHVSSWEQLLHPDDVDRAREIGEAVARGGSEYQGEFRLRHKRGHYIHVLTRGLPIRRDPDGPAIRIVGTHLDLTERRRAESERARTELLARLVFAQEDERRRIAREMHDQFGEQLTTLAHRIDALRRTCAGNATLEANVAALDRVAQQLDRDVDQLVWELRPTALDDLGLRAALANCVHAWSARTGIATELHTLGSFDDRLPPDVETTLYRIAQEALTNVARHSQASTVDVILERRSEQVLLVIEDDGIGFEPDNAIAPKGGFGLFGMRERAALVGASLQIESAEGRGTTILVRVKTHREARHVEHA